MFTTFPARAASRASDPLPLTHRFGASFGFGQGGGR
jgi:hypothetical protein